MPGCSTSGILFAVAYGVLLFDEPLQPMAMLGMVLIVGAGVVSTLLARRSVPRAAPPTPDS